ncbi:hypothetical protein [Tenacibaculum amylolyticum]|uniref:hypothetical protein n=1 Tax=Tenacibaculum amylolyticum TaxID=104269 RepID=UPI00389615C7
MGENKHIEELDTFAKKYINELEVEKPSIDFTKNIMDTILQQEDSKVYKATPLISKKVWILLLGILSASIFYISRGKSVAWDKIPGVSFGKLPEMKVQLPNLFENISISNTMLYAVFFFTILVFVQMYLFKHRFDKDLNS